MKTPITITEFEAVTGISFRRWGGHAALHLPGEHEQVLVFATDEDGARPIAPEQVAKSVGAGTLLFLGLTTHAEYDAARPNEPLRIARQEQERAAQARREAAEAEAQATSRVRELEAAST